ncbi:uncharacterized protein LOC124844233 isoform X2 [Vigna umbellata]|uniref:uncharacterized protein LOC124844233 isoform X2 n=1 Tax=Vigna umbellata TaxID=87088 RepID=UPI001F5EA2D7|nr:uncharacterized protein LOC124844233 isoform X2 [Vigna umbellata]
MSKVDFEPQHSRLFIPNFLSLNECRELEFIHKSSSTVGYRPNVFSTTLSHLIATNSSHLVIPFIPIRERLKDRLEEFFKCEYELVIEFTGLISWSKGASIGWHSDDNRPYLKQRHFSAVCYLNSYGKDFSGGIFHFQDGEPKSIMPKAGDVVMYTADDHNIHSVDEITEGERLTVALWFSRDGSHDEDKKLISLLSQHLLHKNVADSYLPLPASGNMYWFSHGQASDCQIGFNICWARLHVLGYDIYISQDSGGDSDVSDLLVVHFYCWQGSALLDKVSNTDSKVVKVTDVQREKISGLNSVLSNDDDFASKVFCNMLSEENRSICFDWSGILAAVAAWEDYALNISQQIHLQFPYWKIHESIYNLQLDEQCSTNKR